MSTNDNFDTRIAIDERTQAIEEHEFQTERLRREVIVYDRILCGCVVVVALLTIRIACLFI